MEKLLLAPDEDGYSVTDNATVIQTAILDGGLSRDRLDEIGGSRLVNLKWSGSKTRYQTVRDFFDKNLALNCPQFLIDLIIGKPVYQEYTCNIVPQSINTSPNSDLDWSISAQFEVCHWTKN